MRFLSTVTFLVLTFGSLLSILVSPTVSAGDATPNAGVTPTAPAGSADLTVNLFNCPAGYDLGAAGANPAADCTDPVNGATFTINGQNSAYFSQENTGDSVNGAVYFGGVPAADTYAIQETPPSGITQTGSVGCDGGSGVTLGATVNAMVNDGDTLACAFYNVPQSAATATMTVTPSATVTATTTQTVTPTMMASPVVTPTTETGNGDIFVDKFTCPVGYNETAPGADPTTDCPTSTDGVTFVLQQQGGSSPYFSQSNTGDSIPGAVMFGGAPAGDYTITETPPVTNDHAFLLKCVVENGGNTTTITPTLTANAIALHLSDKDKITCYWYNVPNTSTTPTVTPTMSASPTPTMSASPETGNGDIFVYKYLCPKGYDETKSGANPAADCTAVENGVTFVLQQTDSVPMPYFSQSNTGDSINGAVMFGGAPAGNYTVTETLPAGITHAFVLKCDVVNGGSTTTINPTLTGYQIALHLHDKDKITCYWYNVPKTNPGDLDIYKYYCTTATFVDTTSCTLDPVGSVSFEVYRQDGSGWVYVTTATTRAGGLPAEAPLLDPGTYKFIEIGMTPCHVTGSYHDENANDVPIPDPATTFPIVGGTKTVVTTNLNVYNCTGGYGDVTVYKWTCPKGYDYTLPGADPKVDCKTATNGITFVLQQQGGSSPYFSQSNTGDSINGAVYFGGAPAGTYTVTETVPPGIASEFVWDCSGASTSWVNPIPLSTGNVLNLKLHNGDKIVCNWYNVPAPDPQTGDLTIHKYLCTGTKFTSPVDCFTYQNGMKFEIDSGGAVVTTATTNQFGVIALSGLAPGTYTVKELGGTPCYTSAAQLDANNNTVNVKNPDGSVKVTNGRETVVSVYNCKSPGKNPPPTVPVKKFPNTGVNPADAQPGYSGQDTQVIEPDSTATATATAAASLPTATTTSAAACPQLSVADGQTGTPIATPQAGLTCARGAVPAKLSIPSIKVDATVEVKEIVAGEMQEPSTSTVVTWYKETNRLGETGNIVIAGHLNYWGIPEGVFFNLGKLKVGDQIVLTGEDGKQYTYQVTTVGSLPIDEGPAKAIAPTRQQTLTLMTCGGDWDSSISEYNARTVVTAVRIDKKP